VQPEDEKRMKIDLQCEEARCKKYDAEYEQLKWIDNIMDSEMMIQTFLDLDSTA
jgi:hypothetical protein